MSSRALPDNFDMTQALHSPFGAPTPNMGTPMPPSGGAYSHFGTDSNAIRPLTLDTLRRVPDYEQFNAQYTSPTAMNQGVGAYGYTPPQSATETISPGSAPGEYIPYGAHSRHPQGSPRRPPYGFNAAPGSSFYNSHGQVSRLQMQDRFARPISETISSPLRTSMSYSALGSASASQNQPSARAASFSEHSSGQSERPQLRSLTNPATSGSGPYGLGFTCRFNRLFQRGERTNFYQTAVECHRIKVSKHRNRSSSLRCHPVTPARKSMPSSPTEGTAARLAGSLDRHILSISHRPSQRRRCRNTLATVRRTRSRRSLQARTNRRRLKAPSSTDSRRVSTTLMRRTHRCTANNNNRRSNNTTTMRVRRTRAVIAMVECPCPHRTSAGR